MISKERVEKLALEKIIELNYFLVDIKINSNNEITVYFDNEEGVLIPDILKVSRHIEGNLDRDIEDYQLTVCSPGIDKAFVVKEQYQKNIGRDVKIKTTEGDVKKGKLLSYSDEEVVIETSKKKKKKKELLIEELTIPSDKIKETKLIIKFK
ncbi:MAG: ribosome assembly cofactor RimP [Flavobacteriales bacterium]|jgi:ribosome maturation factor RimP|nr:ribosome assembly cofactor RimP [Flavobacteriales bacterium]MBT6808590.1 ribosome assembly cofactor RimP [Flavobacteriales bacterium]